MHQEANNFREEHRNKDSKEGKKVSKKMTNNKEDPVKRFGVHEYIFIYLRAARKKQSQSLGIIALLSVFWNRNVNTHTSRREGQNI